MEADTRMTKAQTLAKQIAAERLKRLEAERKRLAGKGQNRNH
jgi:hypothetical protein